MFNLSLLADIEEEVVEQPAEQQETEEVVDIEEQVAEEDATEEVPATVEEVAQAEEGGDIEVKDTEVLAESQVLSAQFDELLAMQNHVAKFGVDRTFLSLFNKGGRLGRALGVNIPACESIDAVGYPTSALSLACLEAFDNKEKGVVAKIVDFIVALVQKIKNLAKRFWTWFTGLFDNQAAKWQKLQNISKNRIVTKDADKNVVIPALGVDFDVDLGKRLQGLGFWNILKSVFGAGAASITNDDWSDGTNARKLAEEISGIEHDTSKSTTITNKQAGAALKRLANNIRVSFKEMDQVKKTLGDLNERIKFAENVVTKAKNGVEKSLNFGGASARSSNAEAATRSVSFGSGDKRAVVAAKNALIDLKARQSVVQKVSSVYTRCIKVMLRSYGNVLFTLTDEKA